MDKPNHASLTRVTETCVTGDRTQAHHGAEAADGTG